MENFQRNCGFIGFAAKYLRQTNLAPQHRRENVRLGGRLRWSWFFISRTRAFGQSRRRRVDLAMWNSVSQRHSNQVAKQQIRRGANWTAVEQSAHRKVLKRGRVFSWTRQTEALETAAVQSESRNRIEILRLKWRFRIRSNAASEIANKFACRRSRLWCWGAETSDWKFKARSDKNSRSRHLGLKSEKIEKEELTIEKESKRRTKISF